MTLPFINIGTTDDDGTGDPLRDAFRKANVIFGGGVIDRAVDVGGATATDGNLYIVPASATGAWAGEDGKLAYYNGRSAAWEFYTAPEGMRLYDRTANEEVESDGALTWTVVTSGGGGGGTSAEVTENALVMEETTYDLSVTTLGTGNELDVDMAGYEWAEIEANDLTCGSSETLVFQVGVTTPDAGASDYEAWLHNDGFGQASLAQSFMRGSGDGTSQIGGAVKITGFNNAGVKTKLAGRGHQSSTLYSLEQYRNVAQADDILRILTRNGNDLTGGQLVVRKFRKATLDGSIASSEVLAETEIGTYDLSVNTLDAGNEIVIDADGYEEIEFILTDGAVGSSGAIVAQVSTDNVTYRTGASDYRNGLFANSFLTVNQVDHLKVVGATGTANLFGKAIISNMNDPDVKTFSEQKAFTSSGPGGGSGAQFNNVAQVDRYVRLQSLNGNAFTAGTLKVIGRKKINVAGGINRPAAISASQNATEAMFAGNVYQEVDTSGGNVTITIPAGLLNAQPCTFENIGPNSIIFATSSTTINSAGGALNVATQYGVATVVPKGSDTYTLFGDIS